jgi:hypothetical protein
MKIDRSNYEIWFIDRLDGNLTEQQTEQLMLFLSENPDLQDELRDMDSSVIIPPPAEFTGKAGLRKTAAEITDIQFEYLCAAYAENDLSPEEVNEFSQITASDPRRRKTAELIGRIKLLPPDIRYLHKNRLRKTTPFQRTLRLSAALLGTAATIALLITLSVSIPGNEMGDRDNISQTITNENATEQPVIQQLTANPPAESGKSEDEVNIIAPATSIPSSAVHEIRGLVKDRGVTDIIHTAEVLPCSAIVPVYYSGLKEHTLIRLSFNNPVQADDRWAAGRFVAKLFREKILKEETVNDSPIKGYEIAEAGVAGLNRLLGWEMALEKSSYENGEPKSVYFSSKVLKIQAPVNRTESSY